MKDERSKDQSPDKINCVTCKHYFVTWEPAFPKGCRAYGFKTSELPSVLVKRSSGLPCMNFESKF
jgi:hypothetical protein